jgi:hypothetical protein
MKDRETGTGTVDVTHCRRQLRLVLAAMIERDVVPLPMELGHYVWTDEIGTTDDEDPHGHLATTS